MSYSKLHSSISHYPSPPHTPGLVPSTARGARYEAARLVRRPVAHGMKLLASYGGPWRMVHSCSPRTAAHGARCTPAGRVLRTTVPSSHSTVHSSSPHTLSHINLPLQPLRGPTAHPNLHPEPPPKPTQPPARPRSNPTEPQHPHATPRTLYREPCAFVHTA